MGIVLVGSYPLSADCIRGGVESSVYGLAQTLVARKHVVDVFDYPRLKGSDKSERNDLLTIHRYANNGTFNQDATQRAKEIFRDIVALHPNIVHLHGTGELSLLLYQAAAVTRPDKINEYYTKGKISHLPTIEIIPQGINEHFITLYNKDKKPAKNILSVGAISKRKGHLFLVDAFEKVCQQVPDAQLVITGVKSEVAYYDLLTKRIASSNCKERIRLLIDLPQEELYDYYSQATIFALHSEEESQGIALVEAMASGLPVVSTNVGGIPDVVTQNKTGLLSTYGDSDIFADNMVCLLQSPNMMAEMSVAAHNQAKEYFP